jgi:Lrp/AsnC family leucine-responsive transcriptional regulator
VAAESEPLDQIDREILGVLRDDARISYQALGARVHLSPNAAADRVRRLVRRGVITRFTIELDQSKLGRDLVAVVDVRTDDAARFRDGALACDEVTWLAHVTGSSDFRVHVATRGSSGLNALLRHFKDDLGATETLTTVVLERFR